MSIKQALLTLNAEIFTATGAIIKTTPVDNTNSMELEVRNGSIFGTVVTRSIVVGEDGVVKGVMVVGRGRKGVMTYTKQIACHGDYVFSYKGGNNVRATYAHICLAGELYPVAFDDNHANSLMIEMPQVYHNWLQGDYKQPTNLVVGDAFDVQLWSKPPTRNLTARERLTQDLNRIGDEYVRRSGEVACNLLLKTVHRLKDEITKS